eukprot:scaffold64985_cov57-Phaeocystis_antarctica.AAC.1
MALCPELCEKREGLLKCVWKIEWHSASNTLRDIGVGVPKASVWRRRNAASRLSLLCEASLAVQGPWMAAACRAGMKGPAEKTSWSCAELLEFAP